MISCDVLFAISDMFELESSKLVATKGQDAKIKSFAEKMIKDHTETSTELKAIAARMSHSLPTAMDSAHQKKVDDLKAEKDGKEFDEEYIDEQVTAHRTLSTFSSDTRRVARMPILRPSLRNTSPIRASISKWRRISTSDKKPASAGRFFVSVSEAPLSDAGLAALMID